MDEICNIQYAEYIYLIKALVAAHPSAKDLVELIGDSVGAFEKLLAFNQNFLGQLETHIAP